MKTKRFLTVLALVLSLCTLLATVPTVSVAAEAVSKWDGTSASTSLSGSGSETDPYLIQSAADFKYFQTAINDGSLASAGKYFKQTVDIDLDNKTWIPIGLTNGKHFAGYYDGGNHTISNLTINDESVSNGTYKDKGALFGWIYATKEAPAKISNLSIVNGTVKGDTINRAAGLCSIATNLLVENVHTDVDLTPVYDAVQYAGGLISEARGELSISNCVAEGDITIKAVANQNSIYVGGLVGTSAISNATDWAGTSRTITNSYYTGNISVDIISNNSNTRIGGIAGAIMNGVTVNQTYMLGTFSYTNVTQSGNIANCRVGNFIGGFGYGQNSAALAKSIITNSKCVVPASGDFTADKMIGNTTNSDVTGLTAITNDLTTEINLRALQRGTGSSTDTFNIRLLATVNSLNYQNVGYSVTAVYGEKSGDITKNATKVYSSIKAGETTYTADALSKGADDYIVALAVNNIPTTGTVAILVTPFITTNTEAAETLNGNTTVILYRDGMYVGYFAAGETN